MHKFLKFIFGIKTLHVSARFSACHQESSTVYTAIPIGYAESLLAGSGWILIPLAISQHNLYDI